MFQRLAPWPCLAALAAAAPGCSLLFDPDKIPVHSDGGPPDAGPPDARDDADPAQLDVMTIEGPAGGLYEGMGSGGGRPVVLVVTADSVVGEATIEAVWDVAGPEAPTVVGAEVSSNDEQIAIALRLPVLSGPTEDSGTLDLRVTVAQDGTSESITIPVTLLPQLALAGGTVTTIAARYSQIIVTADTRISGAFAAAPPRLVSTGAITIAGDVLVNAQNQTAGPHSCNGGGPSGAPTCGGAGAGADAAVVGDGAGGGGGGCAGPGNPGDVGAGANGGVGGTVECSPMMVPFGFVSGTSENRGHGGGGGGAGTLGLGAGGAGGGGGGVVELRAGGAITVSGVLNADGAPGANGSGAGGGGSGGVVLVRAIGGVAMAADGWITAGGRPGGMNVNNGGAGAPGRIRVDSPTAFGAVSPPAVSAPMFVGPPELTADAELTLSLRGSPGVYTVTNTHDVMQAQADVTIDDGGEGTVPSFDLFLGRNEICALYAQIGVVGTNVGLSEAKNCIEIVYIP